jgi:hypothetical protein
MPRLAGTQLAFGGSSNQGTHETSGGASGQGSAACVSQSAAQHPSASQSGTSSPAAQNRPAAHCPTNSHGSPSPTCPPASGLHTKPPSIGRHAEPPQSPASGLQQGSHTAGKPSSFITQELPGSSHEGSSGEPVQKATQVPVDVLGSTSQHIDFASQSSIPLVNEPSTIQASPGWTASGATGTHRRSFHVPLPSLLNGTHFDPSAQSCWKTEHG